MATLAKCNVCMDEFGKEGDKIPKLLPCTHTVCLWCLSQFIGRGIRCPECRAHHPVPTGGPKAFPTNRYVVEILDLIQQNPTTNRQQDHKSEAEELQCEEHQKPYVMVCLREECWSLLCPKCPMHEHQGHNLAGFGEDLGDFTQLAPIKEELLQEINKLCSLEVNLKRSKDVVFWKEDEAERAINEKASQLKRAIDENANNLKRRIMQQSRNQTRKLDHAIQNVMKHASFGNKLKETIKDFPKKSTTSTVRHLIEMKKGVDNFTESTKREICEEISYDQIEFKDTNIPVINLGEISTNQTIVSSSQLDYVEVHTPGVNTEALEPIRVDIPAWLLPPEISVDIPRVTLSLDSSDDEIVPMNYDFWRNPSHSARGGQNESPVYVVHEWPEFEAPIDFVRS